MQLVHAGDQGIMFGYATDETPEYMPLSHSLATGLGKRLKDVRLSGLLPYLGPDGKTQITVEYIKEGYGSIKPIRVHTVLISQQHSANVSNDKLREDLMTHVVKAVIPPHFLDDKTKYYLNPSGHFVVGGPSSDAGLTGRKVIVDTYGGWGAHGGGCFSGKDGTKVDRSAAYYARKVAKSLVANGFCRRALVQVSYSIGIRSPLSLHVDSYNTCIEGFTDLDLEQIAVRNFDFSVGNIIKELQLKVLLSVI